MDNIKVTRLAPELFYLLDEFCEEEDLTPLNPEFATVVAAIDLDTGKIIGIVVTQLQAHSEPIVIKKEYQGKGLWEEMVDVMEGFLDMMALTKGPFAAYNEPTNAAAERICRMRGYQPSKHQLWTKIYKGGRLWPQQSPPQSDSELP